MYHNFKCQSCFTNLQIEQVPEYCPVCKAYTGDQLKFQSPGSGIKPIPEELKWPER